MRDPIQRFLALFIAIGVITFGAVVAGNSLGALDLWRAQNAARLAEAEASKLQAELELTRARADVTRAQGEAAVLESAARAVDNNTRLVTWYTLRGDLRAILALVGALGLAGCGGVLVVILRGGRDEKKGDFEVNNANTNANA